MTPEVLRRAQELVEARQAFVLATVVWRREPSSARPGASAIVHPDGSVEGWLGGACTDDVLTEQALATLDHGKPRLAHLGDPGSVHAHDLGHHEDVQARHGDTDAVHLGRHDEEAPGVHGHDHTVGHTGHHDASHKDHGAQDVEARQPVDDPDPTHGTNEAPGDGDRDTGATHPGHTHDHDPAADHRGGPMDVAREGVVVVPMHCASEGAAELYLEPMLPPPQVVAIGGSPAVATLGRLAEALGWPAFVLDDGRGDLSEVVVDGRTCIVVATQGHYDEEAVESSLRTDAGYVGLVASKRRAGDVLATLRERGVSEPDLARVQAPAGVDLGSIESHEIAVAILADLVARRAAGQLPSGDPPPDRSGPT